MDLFDTLLTENRAKFNTFQMVLSIQDRREQFSNENSYFYVQFPDWNVTTTGKIN